jgi:hypothetical protein
VVETIGPVFDLQIESLLDKRNDRLWCWRAQAADGTGFADKHKLRQQKRNWKRCGKGQLNPVALDRSRYSPGILIAFAPSECLEGRGQGTGQHPITCSSAAWRELFRGL